MRAAKIVSGILALLVSLPIWFFLQYRVLVMVNATELMWFLFWVYLPVSIIVNVIAKVTEDS